MIDLKQTRGIKNFTLKAAKKSWVSRSTCSKGGHGSKAFQAWSVETGDENTTGCFISRTYVKNAVFCEDRFERNHALYVHLRYKFVDRFRKGRSTN